MWIERKMKMRNFLRNYFRWWNLPTNRQSPTCTKKPLLTHYVWNALKIRTITNYSTINLLPKPINTHKQFNHVPTFPSRNNVFQVALYISPLYPLIILSIIAVITNLNSHSCMNDFKVLNIHINNKNKRKLSAQKKTYKRHYFCFVCDCDNLT